MTLKEALSYTPTVLTFGTSGLRGLVTDMTDLECYINAAGFLAYLKAVDDLEADDFVFLGGDLRLSTPRIMAVMQAAIENYGCQTKNCGILPTPAIAYHALYADAPCIMVTGSHIPADRNGIKFYKRSGEVLKIDEAAIQHCVADVRSALYAEDFTASLFDATGQLKVLPTLSAESADAKHDYLDRYVAVFPHDAFAGKQIIIYQQSAVGRDLLVELFTVLGAEAVPIERSESFLAIDTENVTDTEKQRFVGFANRYPDAFAIISTDGDSDRPFVIDELGTFHRGDVLGCVVAEYLGAVFAAIPISSNDAADTVCQAQGITLVHTKIGSPYVIAAMQAADDALRPMVGWEVNGGFLLGSDITFANGTLKALPTRDAVLPILCSLLAAIQAGSTVSELFGRLPKRYTGGALIDDVPEQQIQRFRELSTNEAVMQRVADTIFKSGDNGPIDSLNITDGLRLRFQNGSVIHLRPSGNAPQFRVYSNAGSQAAADTLADAAVSPNGYITQLLDAIEVQ